MARLSCTLLAWVRICAPHQAQAQQRPDPSGLALTHVTVIDVTDGSSQVDQTLVVMGNRITRVGPSPRTPVPPSASVIDAHGRVAIPGLWDMHVHLFRHSGNTRADVHERYFPLFFANGVTGVRDMWTSLEDFQAVRAWHRDEATGSLLGPRVAGSSTIVDGVPTIWPKGSIGVMTAAEARRVVDSLARGGAEFIKSVHRSVA
jgi:hypothetical protein